MFVVFGCATTSPHRFPLRSPLWADDDRRAFAPKPAEHYNSWIWDGADNATFRPLAELWTYEETREAINVNSLDEVPSSSWFENRIGQHRMTREELAAGACAGLDLPAPPWTIIEAKSQGDTPGFIIEAQGQRYLFKTDIRVPELTTAADSIATRIFYAVGYSTPCNYVVHYAPDYFRIDPGAEVTRHQVREILRQAVRAPDGRLRGSLSRFIDGDVLGGWRFDGRRGDDPNDVVPHQHRREVRGMYVLSAWLNHIDSRAENNFDAWVSVDGTRGFVRHYILDVGDSFGLTWDRSDELTRRFGHSYYLDLEHVAVDFFSLGIVHRPYHEWPPEDVHPIFTYYDVERFVPDGWRNGYPNPGFDRRTEHDTAWMARILSQFREEDLRALVATGSFSRDAWSEDLVRILRGRQRKILERYLTRLSPLAFASVVADGSRSWLCLRDLAVESGIRAQRSRRYRATATIDWPDPNGARIALSPRSAEARVCTPLPERQWRSEPRYLVIEVVARSPSDRTAAPASIHLYQTAPDRYRIVGLRRPGPQ